MTVRSALVIGGGIAGPATALALRKAGIEATVFEAYRSSADGIGGLLTLAPNGLAALRVVGVDEAVRDLGEPIERMVLGDGRGRTFGAFDGVPGLPPSRAIWRADLCRVLHDHAVAQGIPVEYGKRLAGVDEGHDGAGITARFADGSTATADVLVGADGIRSTVRTLIDPQAPGPDYVGLLGFGGFGGYAAETGVSGEPRTMHFSFGDKGFFGYWTEADGRNLWFSNLPHPEPMSYAEARAVPPAEWLAKLRAVHATDTPAREMVAQAGDDQLFVLGGMEILPSVPHWSRGRMVLVGDSAHAPSPSSGQGASIAVESAVQLARCLRDLPDLPTAFDAYERLRRPRVERIAAAAARTNNQKAAGPIAKAVLRVIMPIALKTVLNPAKRLRAEQGYQIDWSAPVAPGAGRAATRTHSGVAG